jgi:FkbM family methyltransferase
MDRFSDRMIARWPIYGVVKLRFDDISFNMYSKGDDNIVQLLYYNKNYHEYKDLRLFLQLAKNASVIFDIGANTGVYSILSGKANPVARLFSFEPYPVNVTRLKKNLMLNNTDTEIVQKALGNKEGFIGFAVPSNDSIADTSSAEIDFSKNTYDGKISWKTIEVEQITLDSFVKEKNFDRIDLLKIDVEGYEEAVFKGATGFFKEYKPVIQCEIFLDEKKKLFFENFLKENNYTAYLILNDGILNVGKLMSSNPGSMNYLFSCNDTPKQFYAYAETDGFVYEMFKRM